MVSLAQVGPDEVAVGDVIVVKPGERVPIDGVILEGATQLDTAALTGESVPRHAEAGDEVISGCVNMTGVLARAHHQALRRVHREPHPGARGERQREEGPHRELHHALRTRLYAGRRRRRRCCWPWCRRLLTGAWADWILRGLTFLVVSCPCALVISVPLSFFGGIGGASQIGVLVKGSNYLEALSEVDTVVFDKTGTLTNGTFDVVAVHPQDGVREDELLELRRARRVIQRPPHRGVRPPRVRRPGRPGPRGRRRRGVRPRRLRPRRRPRGVGGQRQAHGRPQRGHAGLRRGGHHPPRGHRRPLPRPHGHRRHRQGRRGPGHRRPARRRRAAAA